MPNHLALANLKLHYNYEAKLVLNSALNNTACSAQHVTSIPGTHTLDAGQHTLSLLTSNTALRLYNVCAHRVRSYTILMRYNIKVYEVVRLGSGSEGGMLCTPNLNFGLKNFGEFL
jgi:hypothetical protein